jgi:regulator of protease activity HflC (stomatin/prohibitin superfamily)
VYNNTNNNQYISGKQIFVWISFGVFVLGGGIGSCAYLKPKYNVWAAEQEGMAQYAQAEQNRKIAILEAESKLEASRSLAAAEIERAKGVAEANKIIGESLKGNDSYLRWQWIQNLEGGGNAVIYVPTEAGLPILEAGKR